MIGHTLRIESIAFELILKVIPTFLILLYKFAFLQSAIVEGKKSGYFALRQGENTRI